MRGRRPTDSAFNGALDAAERLRETDADPHHIAASLQYLLARNRLLETLFTVTDRYLRFGMPEHELSEMRRLIEHLREETGVADDPNDVEATLPI